MSTLNEPRPCTKRKADTTDRDAEEEVKRPRTDADAHESSRGHTYSAIYLSGNARAIIGDVHGVSDAFFGVANTEDKRRLLLRALHYENMSSRREQLGLKAGSPDSVQWVWSTDLRSWAEGSQSFFWITGLPGSGKSTLMKHLAESKATVDHLSQSGETWFVIHFFFDFRAGQTTPNSIEGLLRSLLYQVVKNLPSITNAIDDEAVLRSAASKSLQQQMDCLCDAIKSAGSRVCVFIDGLDEFQGSTSQLLDVISSLEGRGNLKICMASRPTHFFQNKLSKYLHLQVQDHNTLSIRSYVEECWHQYSLDTSVTQPKKLVQSVVERASGNFLQARLIMDELSIAFEDNNDMSMLWQILDSMPLNLQDMYQSILDRLPKFARTQAALLMHLLLASEGRLQLRKLFAAHSALSRKIGLEHASYSIDDDKTNESRIYGLLGGLVDVSQKEKELISYRNSILSCEIEQIQEVRFVHETLRTFLSGNVWLHVNTPDNVKLNYPEQIWLKLQAEEVAECSSMERTSWKELADAFTEYICTLHTKIQANRLMHDDQRSALLRFLHTWTTWTPFLPFALHGLFSALHNRDNAEILVKEAHSAVSEKAMLLHSAMCVFYKYSGLALDWFVDQSCGDIVLKPEFLTTISQRGSKMMELILALGHGVSRRESCRYEQELAQLPDDVRQAFFDRIFDKCLHGQLDFQVFRPMLEALLQKSLCAISGIHLCQTFIISEAITQSLIEMLERYSPKERLAQHHRYCHPFRQGINWCTVKLNAKIINKSCSFVEHWSYWEPVGSLISIKLQISGLLNILLKCGEHAANVAVTGIGALVYALFDCEPLVHPESRRLLKLIAALQAGSSLGLKGPWDPVLQCAQRYSYSINYRIRDVETTIAISDEFHDMLCEEAAKMVELLNYCAQNNGQVPADIEEYAKYSPEYSYIDSRRLRF